MAGRKDSALQYKGGDGAQGRAPDAHQDSVVRVCAAPPARAQRGLPRMAAPDSAEPTTRSGHSGGGPVHPGSLPEAAKLPSPPPPSSPAAGLAIHLSELGVLLNTSCLYHSQDFRSEGSSPMKIRAGKTQGADGQVHWDLLRLHFALLRSFLPAFSGASGALTAHGASLPPGRALSAAAGARGSRETGWGPFLGSPHSLVCGSWTHPASFLHVFNFRRLDYTLVPRNGGECVSSGCRHRTAQKGGLSSRH